jgi:hypothetical protein
VSFRELMVALCYVMLRRNQPWRLLSTHVKHSCTNQLTRPMSGCCFDQRQQRRWSQGADGRRLPRSQDPSPTTRPAAAAAVAWENSSSSSAVEGRGGSTAPVGPQAQPATELEPRMKSLAQFVEVGEAPWEGGHAV